MILCLYLAYKVFLLSDATALTMENNRVLSPSHHGNQVYQLGKVYEPAHTVWFASCLQDFSTK
jgi:hypothetical protein